MSTIPGHQRYGGFLFEVSILDADSQGTFLEDLPNVLVEGLGGPDQAAVELPGLVNCQLLLRVPRGLDRVPINPIAFVAEPDHAALGQEVADQLPDDAGRQVVDRRGRFGLVPHDFVVQLDGLEQPPARSWFVEINRMANSIQMSAAGTRVSALTPSGP